MRCAEWEERIALHAGGDGAGEAAEVARHLDECAECREFERELRETLALLGGAHAEAIPAAAYTAVRARVRGAIGRRRRGWVLGSACAAAVVVLGMAGIEREMMRIETLPRVALAPPPSAPVMAQTHGHPASPVVNSRPRQRRAARSAPETILVKLETDNPEVVIYWIAETKGEN